MSIPGEQVGQTPGRSSLCPCGSGLRYKRCCGMQKLERLSQAELQRLAPAMQQAEQARRGADPRGVEQRCVAVLDKAPGHPGAIRMLYDLRAKEGNGRAAEVLLRRYVKVMPNDIWGNLELGMLLYQSGDMLDAEVYARNAVRLAPEHPQAHNLMGMIMTDRNRLHPGEFHYRRALELHEPVGKLCANLGLNLKRQGKLEEAEAQYREAMRLEPDNVASLLGWVRLEEAKRDMDRAWELLAEAEAKSPDSAQIATTRANLHMRAKDLDAALGELDGLLERRGEKALGPSYFFDRGRVLDKMGRYDEAFAAFDHANQRIRDGGKRQYDRRGTRQLADQLKRFMTGKRFSILPRAGVRDDVPQPIFIVGFPRSGTTMVEQIVTSLPTVCAGDELNFIWDLTAIAPRMLNSPLGYPSCLADLWMGDNMGALNNMRDYYLQKTGQLSILEEGATHFTDKMPLNEVNLGFISLIFPAAPLLHLIRHPLDVVLSVYFNDLTHGANMAYDLATAATHYALTMDLVEHYRQELDMNYMAVRYEDIVADQEAMSRQIIEFTGQEWDPACLEFHENPRYARTASYAQVTEKLYTSSVERYRNYRKHLEPVLPILEPMIERLGYSVD